MIYFYPELVTKVLETIKDAHDCADILYDLNRIEMAKVKVYSPGGVLAADQLGKELQKKYPTIDAMLNIAEAMRSNSILLPSLQSGQAVRTAEDVAISNLEQDRYGILCDTAVKKGITQEIKQFIESVD